MVHFWVKLFVCISDKMGVFMGNICRGAIRVKMGEIAQAKFNKNGHQLKFNSTSWLLLAQSALTSREGISIY